MDKPHYDVLIIGSGPGGEGAAMKLAKSGRRVAVIEAHEEVGGGCLHWGTIPSKSLRQSIQVVAEYHRNPLFQQTGVQIEVDYPQLLKAAGEIIQQQVATANRYYSRNKVDVVNGVASFVEPHLLAVSDRQGKRQHYAADHIIIATGSSPYHPPDVDFSHPRIHDSDSILQLDHTPPTLTIYGAGVIGCEYASIFCNLDVKVNLVNTRDRLLSFMDDEITDALSYHLRSQGTVIRNDETYDRVEPMDDGVILHCHSGKQIKTDLLLWANGRSGNTRALDLEALDIEVNSRGQVVVNDRFQTRHQHIYAVGDVVGYPGLASASYDQGRFVGALIADGEADWQLVKDIPSGIYTSPEISSIGRTERELTEQKVPYEVGQASFSTIARAQICGHRVGMLKILFQRESLEILGIHCFGEGAAEIIHIGQAIMSQPGSANSLKYFAETTFNYPTMAEAYRVAALNGLNRLF